MTTSDLESLPERPAGVRRLRLPAPRLPGPRLPASSEDPAGRAWRRRWTAVLHDLRAGKSWPAWIRAVLSRHWLAATLLVLGLGLRIITQLAYSPAIFYIDSVKYLYNAWIGADPMGYKVALKVLLGIGDLGTVTAFQHLCGLAMGVLIYVLLLRRGANRYLAALAMAPILLDGYQLQAEQTIMPDVIFEAMILAAFAVLLWKPTASWVAAIAAGLLIGFAVTVREVAVILVVPSLLYLVVSSREHWIDVFGKCVALIVAFVLPIFLYYGISYALTGQGQLATKGNAPGRMAKAVDCQTIRLPPAVRPLCPTPAEQKESPDWLDHSYKSPLVNIKGVTSAQYGVLISEFDHAVERQQPLRVVGSVLKDSTRLFELTRGKSEDTTPIWRWQFQTQFPVFTKVVKVSNGTIILGVQLYHTSPFHYYSLPKAWGGKAKVVEPLASFLRSYQMHYGYTPGPLLLLFTIAGLIGSLIGLVTRWSSPRGRNMAYAALFYFVAAGGLLLVADLYTFSWRYQLMALVTLPLAGVLGFEALLDLFRRRRSAGNDAVAAPQPSSATADTPIA